MQLIKTILYNASLIGFLNELYRKYPHPFVIHDSIPRDNIDLYETLSAINIQWKSKSLEFDWSLSDRYGNGKEINSVHVFCANKIQASINTITDNILMNSNTFKIQNLILLNHRELETLRKDVLAKHERLHRNTLICERNAINITCWRYMTSKHDQYKQTLIDLLYKPINLNASEILITAQNDPPNAFAVCFSNRYLFTGLDAMVTAEILSKINATPRYCNNMLVKQMQTSSCNKKDKINENDAFELIGRLKHNEKTEPAHIFYHTLFDPRMIKYLFFERAECTGHPDLKMISDAITFNDIMNGLTPSEFTCISLIVPKASAVSSFIKRTFYNSVESTGVICTILIFTVARILISRASFKQWFNIFYSTFRVYLIQSKLTPKTNAERILYGFLLATSILTTVLLSGLIFTNLSNNPLSKPIRTIDDLAASKFKIRTLRSNRISWMENLRDDIREKMLVVDYSVVSRSLTTLDTSTAFAINENLFGLLKTISNSQAVDYKLNDAYYELSEKLHCGYSSYKISSNFQLEDDINQIIQRMIECGFTLAFKKWTQHITKLSLINHIIWFKDDNTPISVVHISGMLYAYIFGMTLSFIVFLGEILVKQYSREVW